MSTGLTAPNFSALLLSRHASQAVGVSAPGPVSFDLLGFNPSWWLGVDTGAYWTPAAPTEIILRKRGIYYVDYSVCWAVNVTGIRRTHFSFFPQGSVSDLSILGDQRDGDATNRVVNKSTGLIYNEFLNTRLYLVPAQTSGGDLNMETGQSPGGSGISYEAARLSIAYLGGF